MNSGRALLGKLAAVLALIGAGAAVGASAPAPWSADPDEQFLLDVTLQQYSVGDGVRAYSTPEGTCVVLGDMIQALDLAVTVDSAKGTATGFAFREDNKIAIDRTSGSAMIAGKRKSFATGDIRETPEGWCVNAETLAGWLGVTLRPETSVSALRVETDQKLPVLARLERRERAQSLGQSRQAGDELLSLPRVRLPYRLWRAPAFDFVVNAGATYNARTGVKVDRSMAITAAGEIAMMSYKVRAQTDGGLPTNVRATLFRSDPDAKLLGPLHATDLAIGDVEGLRGGYSGGGGKGGRGVTITNRPLSRTSDFDKTEFTGDLPPGWDAELYRNGGLVAFTGGTSDNRYHFQDVPLSYGDNLFEIVLYGPQGQVERRVETLNVGQNNVPPGKLWYWAGVRQPGKDLLDFRKPDESGSKTESPSPEAAIAADYGVDKRMSVGALIKSHMVEDERVTFVEGSVRRTVGPAYVEAGMAIDTTGKLAMRAQAAVKIGRGSISIATSRANGFAETDLHAVKAEHRLGLSVPVTIGKTMLPLSANVRLTDQVDGTRALDASARLGMRIGRFNLATETRAKKILSGAEGGTEVVQSLLGTTMIKGVRLRGSANFDIQPQSRIKSAELEANWTAGERTEWQAGVGWEADTSRVRGRVSHIRRLPFADVALTGEAASDGSVAAGVSLNFSMAPFSGGGLRPMRDQLASSGALHARVYEDLNENGRRDPDEPAAKNALVTAGALRLERMTDANGEVVLGSLPAFQPVPVGVDQTTLDNPALTPAKATQVLIPRPGVAATVDIALVGGGLAEGTVAYEDGRGVEGVDIELIDAAGQVIATARSDLDGYVLFERVRYGKYTMRIAKASADAINAQATLPNVVIVSRDKPTARMGTITVRSATPTIAQAGPSPAAN